MKIKIKKSAKTKRPKHYREENLPPVYIPPFNGKQSLARWNRFWERCDALQAQLKLKKKGR